MTFFYQARNHNVSVILSNPKNDIFLWFIHFILRTYFGMFFYPGPPSSTQKGLPSQKFSSTTNYDEYSKLLYYASIRAICKNVFTWNSLYSRALYGYTFGLHAFSFLCSYNYKQHQASYLAATENSYFLLFCHSAF